jgi:hypothetical protein
MVHEHHKIRICPTLADNTDLSVHWGRRGGGIYGHNISLLTLPFGWMHCLLVAFPSRWQVQEQAWFGSTTWGGGGAVVLCPSAFASLSPEHKVELTDNIEPQQVHPHPGMKAGLGGASGGGGPSK